MAIFYDDPASASTARLDEARKERARLEKELDEFCETCEFRYDVGGYEDCGGARVYVPDRTCSADLDPSDLGCRRYEECRDLLDEMGDLDAEIAELEEEK